MKRIFEIQSKAIKPLQIYATPEVAKKFHELIYDTKRTKLVEKCLDIENLNTEVSAFNDYSVIDVSGNGNWFFGLYFDHSTAKWHLITDENLSGDIEVIFMDRASIVDPNDFFFINGIREAFICCDCDNTGTLTDEDGFANAHCQNCLKNAPFSAEY